MRMRWRGLELPTKVDVDHSVHTATYGKFIVEPFERGFGTTVGNSLRRILLSSLEGAAAVSIRIGGAEHEFAQLPGVVEDVTDIILNVKSLIISLEGDTPRKLSVRKQGPGTVTGADLQGDASINVHNKDLVIATLTGDQVFDMELDIHKGRGFVMAAEINSYFILNTSGLISPGSQSHQTVHGLKPAIIHAKPFFTRAASSAGGTHCAAGECYPRWM